MVNNSTKKIISLLMVAVISIAVFVSCGGEKVTQPNSSYSYEKIVAPEETPSDNNSGNNNGDGELTTNLPTWEKDKVFDDVENKDDNKLTTNLPIWEKNKDFSYLLNK